MLFFPGIPYSSRLTPFLRRSPPFLRFTTPCPLPLRLTSPSSAPPPTPFLLNLLFFSDHRLYEKLLVDVDKNFFGNILIQPWPFVLMKANKRLSY